MVTSKLKLEIPSIEAEIARVNVAVLICPGFKVEPLRFQLRVMNCVQFDGFQLDVDIDRVSI
jgi:hypothetical protein